MFSMVIPPPNVTGSLHMGHALNNTLQDILTRYRRMDGDAALWLPGTDHAGIATQNVVERQLLAEGSDRHELGREAFVERTWAWKKESGGRITEQLRALGVSCDWSRERFTLDEGLSRAVREVFVTLYEDGLIARNRYLINMCPRCHTALSDIEVEHRDEKGRLWHLDYPLEDGSAVISVATTRPETMLGDTAVAVHPDDERYSSLVGKCVILPVMKRRIPIIADTYVDRAFGSGAVKITPGHDPNDFEIGLRHQLPMISVMNNDGTMSEEAGEFAGMTTAECREALLRRFEADATLTKVEDHEHAVGTCYRCHSVVEPLLSLQWFLEVKDMAAETLKALDEGRTRFVPAHWEKTYRSWIENIRPWCISRQLWWGHRIPAWYCDPCSKTVVSREDPDRCPDCGGELRQDEDVLDTWFSSALWPFSTMGWPEQTEDLRRFYPTSTLVTGFDIIFFWVARMMMMGIRFMGEVPFRDIYIHALVRDEHGQKMSKSKGNVIDPLDVVDRYGADAFRFTLAAFAAMGRDVRLSEERIGGYRNFVNKLWNAARFAEMKREGAEVDCTMPGQLSLLPNRWIRSRLAAAVADTRKALDEYRFNEAAGRIYQFTWHEFCDWYIEIVKVLMEGNAGQQQESRRVLTAVLETLLRLMHPLIPFVTEELWQQLPQAGRAGGSIQNASYPGYVESWRDEVAEAEMGALIELVRSVRNIRSEMNIPPKLRLELYADAAAREASALAANLPLVERLAGLSACHLVEVSNPGAGQDGGHGLPAAVPAGSAHGVGGIEHWLPVAGHVDIAAEAERLRKALAKLDKDLTRVERKLADAAFLDRAPQQVVDKEKRKQAALAQERGKLLGSLGRVEALGAGS